MAAAGAAAMGLNPWLLGLSGLGALGGLFFNDNGSDRMMKKLNQFYNPYTLANDADTFYKRMLMSPAFSQSKRHIFGGAAQAQSGVANRLAASGIGGSGIGAITGGVASGLAGMGIGDLYGRTHEASWRSALELANNRAGLLAGMGRDRNIPADIYSAFLGSLGPLMLAYGKR